MQLQNIFGDNEIYKPMGQFDAFIALSQGKSIKQVNFIDQDGIAHTSIT